VRLWLKDSERRPDPEPVRTDDRKPMLIGIGLWLLALIALLFGAERLIGADSTGWLWTCVCGIALGLLGLIYTHARRA
jgi:hypothetical protein